MTAQNLNLVDLDFANNKLDLINFLNNQSQFKGYNFAGDNMNVLAELLAYNGNKQAFLTNMLLSEAFLDSAQLMNSVNSRAKELNYLPRSARSAKATVTVNFNATGVSQPYTVQKGDSFSTLVKNTSFQFTIPETIIVSSANNSFSFTSDVYEGTYVQDTYIYSPTTTSPFPRFKITNQNVDTSSLVVSVINAGTTNAIAYTFTSTMLDLTNASQVFFLQPAENGFYEVIFGDNVVGQSPSNNALIILDYRICNQDAPNGATTFSINFDPTGTANELINSGTNNPSVTTVNGAQNGAPPESIESVRFFAPRHFQTQERCIVPSDYQVLLQANFPEINAVQAFGGEDAVPPQFGKVIISIFIKGITAIPNSKITQYTNFIKARNPMSIQPVFINPLFSFIQVNSIVRYNVNITTNSSAFIQSLVNTTINNYNINNLNSFNSTLRLSQLSTLIDQSDPSIISNITNIQVYNKVQPAFGVPSNYTINFGFALNSTFLDASSAHPTNTTKCLSSSLFLFKGNVSFLEDDGQGNVRVSTTQNNQDVAVATVGTINYATGQIQLSNLQIDGLIGSDPQNLFVFVVPADYDVTSAQNTILSIEPQGININVQALAV